MKEFLKIILEHLLANISDVFYLSWSVLLMLLHATHRLSFEATALALLISMICYQFVTNITNKLK